MEGHTTSYWNTRGNRYVINDYALLSNEKFPAGGTSADNISSLLAEIFLDKKELIWGSLETLISFTDGCAAKYCTGSVCYEILLLALQCGCHIDHILQASGHEKCICD